MRKGFTLIELLIVVAIIAILAAIAVPNFLEAQVRAKVARVKNDLRALNTGIETYRVDHNDYVWGSDNPDTYSEEIGTFLGPLAKGYYSFCTRTAAGAQVGRDFCGITTPIAYMTAIPTDPFASQAATFLTYCYRPATVTKNGFVLTSVGPDGDILAPNGKGTTNATNYLSTFNDTNSPSRIGDINERAVIHVIEGTAPSAILAESGKLRQWVEDLSYDPTNGTVSDGDIVRVGPQ